MDRTVGIFPEQGEMHLVFLLPAGKRTQESLSHRYRDVVSRTTGTCTAMYQGT